ncbi:putative inorganic phosphate cotransporter [Nymphalis io]|uniref:putative inorganic phosphate cotransporter n=1 Tax=Inachis io TaxID=171585 RepID=UPI00216833F6|nr:putative inorganic phosphate cotransporter [Nymphalis io]XP_050350946.1 putative inorganic phosphate cotransporter [Nymphalis io]
MLDKEYKKVPIEDVEKETNSHEKEQIKYGFGARHIQALLYFMCLALGYISRGHLGVTIVGMTMLDHDATKSKAATEAAHILVNSTIVDPVTSTEGYLAFNDLNVTSNVTSVDNNTEVDRWNVYRTYNWPKSIQEMVLGSFFLGYSLMMFPIGIVCQRWGGKIPLQIAMFVNGVVSFFTPWLVTWGGWKVLCVLRTMQGLSQSGLYPGILTLLANWVPVSERASLCSYVYTATGFGTVIAFQAAGILAFSRFGWPSTFWATGVACFIGFILITIFGAATPKDHKSISEAEKKYIMGATSSSVETKSKVPWKSVVKSIPVWATIIAHTGNAVCFVFFFMQVPTYVFAILKLNIRNSGLLSSLPYFASFFASIAFGYLSDFLTNRKIMSIKNARRFFNSIACVVPSVCLMSVAYTRDTLLAVICFILFVTCHTAMHTGWMINYMDLSPNFSGALMACGNTITNVVVLALPVIVSYIVTDVTNQYQWRITMFLMAGLTLCTNIIFIIFMSSEVQPWNDSDGGTMESKSEYEAIEPESEKNKDIDN